MHTNILYKNDNNYELMNNKFSNFEYTKTSMKYLMKKKLENRK